MSAAQHQNLIPCTVSLHRFTQAIPVKKSSRVSSAGGARSTDGVVPSTLQQRRQGGRISRTSSAGSPERAVPGGSLRRAPEAFVTPSLYLGHDLFPSGATGFSGVSSARSGEKLLQWKRVNIPLVRYRAALPVMMMILFIALCQSQRNPANNPQVYETLLTVFFRAVV